MHQLTKGTGALPLPGWLQGDVPYSPRGFSSPQPAVSLLLPGSQLSLLPASKLHRLAGGPGLTFTLASIPAYQHTLYTTHTKFHSLQWLLNKVQQRSSTQASLVPSSLQPYFNPWK